MNYNSMTDKQLKALYTSLGGRVGNIKRETLIKRIEVLKVTNVSDTPPASKEMGVGDESDGTFNDVASLGERSIPPVVLQSRLHTADVSGAKLSADSFKPISVLPTEPSQALPVTLGMITPSPVQHVVQGGLSQEEILKATEGHRQRGMTVRFFDNCWEFRRGERMDTGNMAMPLNAVIKCADMACQASISAGRVLKNAMQP